jgi:hypothetical protein
VAFLKTVSVDSVPADPFGANADAIVAAGAAGSISAKLRRISQGLEDLKSLIADDAAFVPGTSLVVPIGFLADETSPDQVDEGDVGAARMTLSRILRVVLSTAAGADLTSLTFAGQAAHGAAVAGNPVRIAGRARTSDYTAEANDDTVDALFDEIGRQVILPYAIPSRWLDGITAAITGTSDTSVIAAQGASTFINLTWALVINSHATVGTVVELKSNTTVRARGYAAALGGGFFARFSPPIKLATNVALNAANVTTGANVYVSAGGYTSAN